MFYLAYIAPCGGFGGAFLPQPVTTVNSKQMQVAKSKMQDARFFLASDFLLLVSCSLLLTSDLRLKPAEASP
jgi:hypothetical protein